MKRTVLMTILAMNLSLGASWANKPTDGSRVGDPYRMTQQAQIGSEGMKAANDPAGQQVPVQSNEPGKADGEKQPVLVAPGGCTTCRHLDLISPWQQFELFLSRIYWI